MDYSKGRYNVFKGRMFNDQPIGRIDEDEFVRDRHNQLMYRVDGDEFYDLNGSYLGELTPSGDGKAMVVDSDHNCLFVLVPE